MPWLLVLKNLLSHPIRSLLTLGSLVVAIFLICFLRTLLVGLEAGIKGSASDRLVVQSAVSLFVDLPIAYQGKIEGVPGVAHTCKLQWFGGVYKEPSNFFAQFAVDHDRFFEAYPEVELIDGERESFLARRSACLVGKKLADRFGFTVGQRVPILGTIFARNDGGAWEFDVAGIYKSKSSNVDENAMFFRFDMLNEALEGGAAFGPAGVGTYVVRLAAGADPVAVAGRIDGLFENGPQRVQATTEAEFQRQFVTMLGSVPTFLTSIGGGVLFAILLAVLNTMLMAGRERTRDLGILKALGFSDDVAFALLISEALLLCVAGGALGAGLAYASQGVFGGALSQIVPNYSVTYETVALGVGIAVGVGLFAGIAPAVQASRLRTVEALRAEV